MFDCCECCVLSGRGLCDELITRPEESYRLWCVVVCDQETTKMLVNEEEPKAHYGVIASREKKERILLKCKKVKQSRYRPGVAQKVPGR